jgi:uncharacterized membrane protein YhdT
MGMWNAMGTLEGSLTVSYQAKQSLNVQYRNHGIMSLPKWFEKADILKPVFICL